MNGSSANFSGGDFYYTEEHTRSSVAARPPYHNQIGLPELIADVMVEAAARELSLCVCQVLGARSLGV